MTEANSFKEFYTEAVKKSGLSAREFIEKAKISRPLHYFYLTGERIPSPETIPNIAAAVGVEAEHFSHLCRTGSGRPPKKA